MKRSKLLYILVPVVILCAACGKEPDSATEEIALPITNEELFNFVTDKWKMKKADALYEYAGKELQALMGKEDFADFCE